MVWKKVTPMEDILAEQFDAKENLASDDISISGDRRLLKQVATLIFAGSS